ncbi:rhodanese-like domain-containing protein [bacterium]|jgi:rhodanese-related sulfurtransferase|nr:rhodanese-like domain-containing protein [bacterium]
MAIQPISMMDLHDAMSALQPTDLVLDCRAPEEFAEGHVPGSRNIPYDAIAPHAEDLKQFTHLYIYCRTGRRAGVATATLLGLGLENISFVDGSGMPEWLEAGFPVEK